MEIQGEGPADRAGSADYPLQRLTGGALRDGGEVEGELGGPLPLPD